MISRALLKIIFASFVGVSAVALYAAAPFAGEQSAGTPAAQAASTSPPSLDYEFFKTSVEPIFLKKRPGDHAHCYICHQRGLHEGRPFSLEPLSPGMTFWTEEQSHRNFETVSKLVIPGAPQSSLLLIRPLSPKAGGGAYTHPGGWQFASKDDPDWKTMEAWILGKKAGDSSAP